MQVKYYSAPELAKMLNVNVSTVKRWVDSGLLTADITPGGHRKINVTHLSKFIRNQYKLANNSYVLRRLTRLKKSGFLDYEKYYNYLFSATTTSTHNILVDYYISGYPLLTIINEVILPVLVKIGEEWAKGRLTISDEHRMTFILRAELSGFESMIEPKRQKQRRTALLACVADEHHEIPLLLLSLLLKQAGWQSVVLGINTPALTVARATKEYKANLVCLTKSYSRVSERAYLNTILKQQLPSGVRIALGGMGWNLSDWKMPKLVRMYKTFSEFQQDI